MSYRKSGTLLTSRLFESLYKHLIHRFEVQYNVNADTFMDYQLFGYGNYNTDKPNLKQYISEVTDVNVNGKYLYNKFLEWRKGSVPIRFTREYTDLYFNAAGYQNLQEFLEKVDLPEAVVKEQQDLSNDKTIGTEEENYVGYSQNEEGDIYKSKLVLSKGSKGVKWILIYRENDTLIEYTYNGEIKYQENGMSFIFDNAKSELDRSLFIGFAYDKSIRIIPYLIGAFSGFDRDRLPVTGVVLFQRKRTWEEVENACSDAEIDSRIVNFLRGKRWTVSGTFPQSLDGLPQNPIGQNSSGAHRDRSLIQTPFYFQGAFHLYFTDDPIDSDLIPLEINQYGEVSFTRHSFEYTGTAFISEGAILSIQITHCNLMPHSAQILAFVGKYAKDQIAWTKGTWHGLDERLSPCTRTIAIVNSSDAIGQEILKAILQSDKSLALSS